MSNASTIRRQIAGTQQSTLAPIVNPSTSQTQFTLNNNGLTLTGGGIIPLSTGVTGLYQGTGQVFRVRAAGSYSGVTAASTTLILELFEVPAALIAAGGLTATSSTGYNAVATSSTFTLTNAVGGFQFAADLQLDSAGNLNGTFSASAGTTTAAEGPTKIAAVTGLVGEADLNFVLAITLGTSEPSTSTFVLDEFAIDLL